MAALAVVAYPVMPHLEDAMITFNDILAAAEIDPAAVWLARHQDARTRGRGIYAIWKSPGGAETVEEYQAVQNHARFDVGGYVASFVVSHRLGTRPCSSASTTFARSARARPEAARRSPASTSAAWTSTTLPATSVLTSTGNAWSSTVAKAPAHGRSAQHGSQSPSSRCATSRSRRFLVWPGSASTSRTCPGSTRPGRTACGK
jgi:hypothetical protein